MTPRGDALSLEGRAILMRDPDVDKGDMTGTVYWGGVVGECLLPHVEGSSNPRSEILKMESR